MSGRLKKLAKKLQDGFERNHLRFESPNSDSARLRFELQATRNENREVGLPRNVSVEETMTKPVAWTTEVPKPKNGQK